MRRLATVLMQAGCAAAFALGACAPAYAAQSPEARLAAYRKRVERLEDQNAIENLQALYGYYFDKGLWNDVADLFSTSGSFEYGQRGVYIGQERIRHALLLFGPQGLAPGHLNNHMQLQAVITVAPGGKTATARWQGMVMLSEPGANGLWGLGVYENAYVKGWTKSLIPMEGQSALFPPDKPPTEIYRALPGAYVPPFGYPHPVTGKPLTNLPQDPDDVVGRQ